MNGIDDAERTARNRYFLIVLANMACVAGAVLGLLLIGRSVDTLPRILGAAILLTGLYCMAVVPKALARRWRSPVE
ncbi:hypothetical protein ACNI3Q_04395 [Sphingomonas sp. FW199]|uniref:hypothetical protein n=1 Tax=Sphingomonas sp. FW199 TaxID=3400217 RepID=UPI003CED0AB0